MNDNDKVFYYMLLCCFIGAWTSKSSIRAYLKRIDNLQMWVVFSKMTAPITFNNFC